ncbi:hypothetical protein SAMN05216343_10976 [Oscillibacter sp. PC13]|uniref:hypothetical protein n=1 Tax=Oscillibacter sp. PC13 TaxID=1855299 RepID=UPI0008E3E9A7|nr:hypothetical protein [Oscillibacter sp. PC13]SFP55614.1 hypothetical protein SAMN05216343_10976 [Oscillibacter sp. PC13]
MYNRYIRNDNGSYTRVPEEEPRSTPSPRNPQQSHTSPPPPLPSGTKQGPGSAEKPPFGPPPPPGGTTGRFTDGLSGFLRHFLDQLHLDHVDTGDLLLLGLLFFLFREDADEELLVALGLLLIL